ncbi:MAG: DUF58 domain-containing protein [Alphaproteobacteria bacterium]|nr:DUF58 domain-containing protein [Alphaproteobacteria bacterium]
MSKIFVSFQDLLSLKKYAKLLNQESFRKSRSMGIGTHKSFFKGQGMELDEIRAYHAGDDIRSINWRITAKFGKPYTKIYREERDLNVYFLSDLRLNMHFGTQKTLKSVLGIKILAALAWASFDYGDKIGAIILKNDGCLKFKPMHKSSTLMAILNSLVNNQVPKTLKKEKTLSEGLKELSQVCLSGGRVVILTDFSDFDDSAKENLSKIASSCEILCIHLFDDMEINVPPRGVYSVANGEYPIKLSLENRLLRSKYQEILVQSKNNIVDFCLAHKITYIPISTNDNILMELKKKFRI